MEFHYIFYGLIIIAVLIIYKYFHNSKYTELSDINSNWKNNGFCKVSNYLTDELEYINRHISFVEREFPNLINTYFNNNIVRNVKRKTIELIRDKQNNPYPFNKEKQLNSKDIVPFSSLSEIDMEDNIISDKEMDLYHRDAYLYDESLNKKEFMDFLNKFIEKLRNDYPNIITKDLDLYHVLCFCIYPGGEKQEIHFDKFYLLNKESGGNDNKLLNSVQVFIPLHDTPIEQGPTIFYKRNMIDYALLKSNGLVSRIDEKNINNPELLNMFGKAKSQERMDKGDIIFMDKDVYHQGGENKTQNIRKTLLIQLV